jgi:hypothetical protein
MRLRRTGDGLRNACGEMDGEPCDGMARNFTRSVETHVTMDHRREHQTFLDVC